MKQLVVVALLLGIFIPRAMAQEFDNTFRDWILKAEFDGANEAPKLSDVVKKQYLTPEWQPGAIVVNDSLKYQLKHMRLNLYHHHVQVYQEGNVKTFTHRAPFEKIIIGGRVFEFMEFTTLDNTRDAGFVELLVDGDVQLLYYRKKQFKDAIPSNGYQEAEPATYQTFDYFLIKQGEGKPHQFSTRRRDLYELLGHSEKQIKQFVKDNRIRRADAEELTQLFQFLNTL